MLKRIKALMTIKICWEIMKLSDHLIHGLKETNENDKNLIILTYSRLVENNE